MKKTKCKLNKATRQFIKPWLIMMSMALAATATAATNDNTTSAFVDSVHQWGAWGLDIEPAAGGLQQPTTQSLNARAAKVDLRTNSISALAPRDRSPVIFTPSPSPSPAPSAPPLPVTPPIPPGKGGPADRLF